MTRGWFKTLQADRKADLVFSGAIALASIVYAFVAAFQLIALNRTLKESKKATHAATIEARAAQQAAHAAEQTLRLTEAPDVEISGIECSTAAFGLDTTITLHYQNFGKTTAHDMTAAFSVGNLKNSNTPQP